jgi:hypothetical protein
MIIIRMMNQRRILGFELRPPNGDILRVAAGPTRCQHAIDGHSFPEARPLFETRIDDLFNLEHARVNLV